MSQSQARPTGSAHDPMAFLRAYVVVLCKLRKRYSTSCISCLYFVHLLSRQFTHAVRFPDRLDESILRVKYVLLVRHPFKIINTIINWVEIDVVNFISGGCWTNKCERDQTMNKRAFLGSVHAKLNAAVTIFPALGLEYANFVAEPANSSDSAYASKVGNLIAAFVARNWLPDFVHDQSPLIDSFRVMLHGSQHGSQFSGATLAMPRGF